MGNQGTVLVVLLLAIAAFSPPAAAHEETHEVPATEDDYDIDGVLDDAAWDDDPEEFDSDDGDVDVQMIYSTDGDALLVALTINDATNNGVADFVDFAFNFQHDVETEDSNAQSIARVDRTGQVFEIDIEDIDDFDPLTDEDTPNDFTVASAPGGATWIVEFEIEWEEAVGGFAIFSYDNEVNDENADPTDVYPPDAEIDDVTTWADAELDLEDAGLSLSVDKTTIKVGQSVILTASIDEDDVAVIEDVTFEKSADETTWTSIGSEDFDDDDGDAQLTHSISEPGTWRFRATTSAEGIFAADTSNVVTVTVTEATTTVHDDGDVNVKYEVLNDGRRNFTLTLDVESGEFPTWEASRDGADWFRLSTGTRGATLVTRWTPPTTEDWVVRPVTYAREGAATVGDEVELDGYSIPSSKTTSTLTLDAVFDAGKVKLTATVEPTAAPGSVTFHKENGATLGTAFLSGGKATFTVQNPAPGTHAYAARYGGSNTHAPSTGSDVVSWFPASVTSPRLTDVSGESITVSHAAGTVEFDARKGDGPGIPGALEVFATHNGTTTTVFQENVPSGSASIKFAPKAEGTYLIEARFHREAGAAVATDVRSVTIEVEDAAVALKLTLPAAADEGDALTATVAFEDAADKPLTVDGGTVRIQQLSGDTWTALESKAVASATSVTITVPAQAPGSYSLRAIYTGAPGFQPATSSVSKLTVTADEPAPDATPDDDGPRPTPLSWALVLAAAAVVAVGLRRR